MSYHSNVQANLDHMGTPATEWNAVVITGEAETTDDRGAPVNMPTFAFPQGYKDAPTLYTGECCGLCGTPIKRVYWIQNDTRKWCLPVGSECVKHFGDGKTGERITQEALWAANREFLRKVIKFRKEIYSAATFKVSLPYGKSGVGWRTKAAKARYDALLKLTKHMHPDGPYPDPDATITRWVGRYGDAVRELIADEALV